MSEEIQDHLLGPVITTAHGLATSVRRKAFKRFRATITAALGNSTVQQMQTTVKAAAAQNNSPAAPSANTPQLTKTTARTTQQQPQASPVASTPPPSPRATPVVGPTRQIGLQKGLAAGGGP